MSSKLEILKKELQSLNFDDRVKEKVGEVFDNLIEEDLDTFFELWEMDNSWIQKICENFSRKENLKGSLSEEEWGELLSEEISLLEGLT